MYVKEIEIYFPSRFRIDENTYTQFFATMILAFFWENNPILMQLSWSMIFKQKPACLTNKKSNWGLFKNILVTKSNINISLKSVYEIDKAMENIIQNRALSLENQSYIQYQHKNSASKLLKKLSLRKED